MEKVRKCKNKNIETVINSMFGIQVKEALSKKCNHREISCHWFDFVLFDVAE